MTLFLTLLDLALEQIQKIHCQNFEMLGMSLLRIVLQVISNQIEEPSGFVYLVRRTIIVAKKCLETNDCGKFY